MKLCTKFYYLLLDETLYNWPLNLHENTGPLFESITHLGCSVDSITVTAAFIVSHLSSPVLVHWGHRAEQLLLHEHMGNYVAEPINKLWQKESFWTLHRFFVMLACVRIFFNFLIPVYLLCLSWTPGGISLHTLGLQAEREAMIPTPMCQSRITQWCSLSCTSTHDC